MLLPKELAVAWALGAADQMHPAPGLVGGVVFSDDRLVMLEGVHLGEIVVAHDLGKTRDEGLRVPD
jgi:hypothetical protein